MKNIRSAALLPLFLFAALLFSGVPAAARADLPAKGALKAQAAQALIDSLDKNLVIIDVRTPGEFSQGHVPGALSLPVEELPARLEEVPMDKPVLFVCRTGRRRSACLRSHYPFRFRLHSGHFCFQLLLVHQ